MTPGLAPLSIRTRLTLWYSGILLCILIVISLLGYSVLRWNLVQDLDASLLTVAQVLRDTSLTTERAEAETVLRELLGPEFYDKFFQLLDPEGRLAPWSWPRGSQALRLSPSARANAARGLKTFETVRSDGSDDVRLLTMPIIRGGRVAQIVQVGMSLYRARSALRRYLDTLVILIPLGVALAAVGGAIIARTAFRPVEECCIEGNFDQQPSSHAGGDYGVSDGVAATTRANEDVRSHEAPDEWNDPTARSTPARCRTRRLRKCPRFGKPLLPTLRTFPRARGRRGRRAQRPRRPQARRRRPRR